MLNGKKAVIFDLDGTLLDTLDDLTASVNHALKLNEMPVHTKEAIRSFVGNGVIVLIQKSVPEGTEETLTQKVLADFKAYYETHSQVYTKLYEGILPLIESLKAYGIKLAIVSNKHDDAVQLLKPTYFDGLISLCIGQRDHIKRKPAPDAVFLALESLEASVDESVYIGDSEVDYATAQAAGMDYIMVTWGFRSNAMLKSIGATVFADHPKEILDLLGLN